VIVPRHRLDLSFADLAFGVVAAVGARHPERRAADLAASWSRGKGALACSSVRAGLDCLLAALELRPGDEVLFSAITHPDMPRIARARGLVPVPLDLDPASLAPTPESLDAAVSERARVLVVAHLFGARADLTECAAFAREHRLRLVEDCAQTILGPHDCGDERADVSLYSFGSIKTATALGGALLRVRDEQTLERMREIEAAWPRQPRREHALKSLKYTVLLALDRPLAYTALAAVARIARFDLDRFVTSTVRAFRPAPGDDPDAAFVRWLRRRPSTPLLALLGRRLRRFDLDRLEQRRAAGARVAAALPASLERPGSSHRDSTHWVFPVVVDDPDRLVAALRAAGFDAARGTSAIAAVDAPADRPELDPAEARRLLAGVVFLPVYPELSESALDRLAAAAGAAVDANAAPTSSTPAAVPA
jgi:dTDP-4-amino-4,6-dideoxygalactose transaminase